MEKAEGLTEDKMIIPLEDKSVREAVLEAKVLFPPTTAATTATQPVCWILTSAVRSLSVSP